MLKALSLLALFSVQSLHAADCAISREVSACTSTTCAASAESDFAAYVASEQACGVINNSVPFILKADSSQPVRGTVVLLHGLTAGPAHMRDIAERLQGQGYNVVVPILQGHGGTNDLLTTASLKAWKNDAAFAGAIATKLGGPLYIGGHSTGGVIAALEASSNPGKYKAIFGLDPAMNVQGVGGWKVRSACKAKYLWNYPSEITSGYTRPSVRTPGCSSLSRRDPTMITIIEYMKAQVLVSKYCGRDFQVPHFNPEFTTQGLCALSQATQEMTEKRLAALPPALLVLSKDDSVFGYINKDQMREAVQANPINRVVQTEAPSHGLMVAHCSPDFEKYMGHIQDWITQHP